MWPKREVAGAHLGRTALSSRACKLGPASKDFRFSCISSSSRFAGEECSQTPANLSPSIFRVFLSSEAQDPAPVTSLCFSSVPGVPRRCCMAAGVDALSPFEMRLHLCMEGRGWRHVSGLTLPGSWSREVSDLSTEPKERNRERDSHPFCLPLPRSRSHLQNDVKKHGVEADLGPGPLRCI